MGEKFRTGYTTGVFDLFHIGHLNIVQRAKEKCEYLIVGVSTDELTQEYKGRPPAIPFAERIRIVEAIRYVDKAVAQTSMDKLAAWQRLRFDVLFHGDDWRGTPLYNKYEQQFRELGVKIVYLPHTAGTSSTLLNNALSSKINLNNTNV